MWQLGVACVHHTSHCRYEFSNKGADLFIESLARLNHYLKSSNSDVTVVAFLIFPTKTNSFNVDSLKGQAITKQLRDAVDDIQTKIGTKIFESALTYVPMHTHTYTLTKPHPSQWRPSRCKPVIGQEGYDCSQEMYILSSGNAKCDITIQMSHPLSFSLVATPPPSHSHTQC